VFIGLLDMSQDTWKLENKALLGRITCKNGEESVSGVYIRQHELSMYCKIYCGICLCMGEY